MEDLFIVRRKSHSQFATRDMAIKFTESGRFAILKTLVYKLDIKDGDALMFAVSKASRACFVFKEIADGENYVCKKETDVNNYRFSAKELSGYISNALELDKEKTIHYLVIDGEIDERGYLKLKAF